MGDIRIQRNKKALIGSVYYNKYNEKGTIIDYNGTFDVIVQLDNGYIFHTRYGQLMNKTWKTPYSKSVYEVGYLGIGDYMPSTGNHYNNHNELSENYDAWVSMLQRCYSTLPQDKKKFKNYEDCSVCEEWHNFQNFAKWFDENKWECDEKLAIDKDIIVKHNKIYSPSTCILVPQTINSCFTKRQNYRGDLPIGVTKTSKLIIKPYVARVNCIITDRKTKRKYLGTYATPEEAFQVYKKYKEQEIKCIADLYKSKYPQFPQKVYDAMYSYQVEITD